MGFAASLLLSGVAGFSIRSFAQSTWTNRALFPAVSLSAVMPAITPASTAQGSTAFDAIIQSGLDAAANGKYEEAAGDFQRATELEPDNAQAQLYYGYGLLLQTVPGVRSQENIAMTRQAIAVLEKVLKLEPEDGLALRGIASAYFNIHEYEQARQTQLRIAKVAPNDAEAHYTIGVLDWALVYEDVRKRSTTGAFSADSWKMPAAACAAAAQRNSPIIEDAIEHLNQASALASRSSDTVLYLNLVFRLRAGSHCGGGAARNADLEKADEYVGRAMALRRADGAFDMDSESAQPASRLHLPRDLLAAVSVPPPPPPPPPPPS